MFDDEIVSIAGLRERSVAMLRDVKQVLDESGISYWIDFGTLLGAVREGRSILWDGDFDLSTSDANVEQKASAWQKLDAMGYDVSISYNNITIKEKSWRTGWYKIDLHRYRPTADGQIEYLYGSRYVGKLPHILIRICLALKASTESTLEDIEFCFTAFDTLCSVLMNDANVDPAKLEDTGDLVYRHGDMLNADDFTLKVGDNSIIKSALEKESGSFVIIYRLFRRLPDSAKKSLLAVTTGLLANAKVEPVKTVRFSERFFANLGSARFHGMEFRTPDPADEYLSLIYGDNWKVPKTSWDLSRDSKIDE